MHYYQNGKLVDPRTPGALPSVTTILDVRRKPWLENWRLRVGEEAALIKTRASQDKGTAVHKIIETYLKTGFWDSENEHSGLAQGFLDWYHKIDITGVQSEVYLESGDYGYAGSADLICQIDGELWIVDFKTSTTMDAGMGLQLRAYERAFYEMSGLHAHMAILQLTNEIKRGYRFKSYDEPLEVFLAHKVIHDWNAAHEPHSAPIPTNMTI